MSKLMSELEVDLPRATCYFTQFYWEETFNKAEYRLFCVETGSLPL